METRERKIYRIGQDPHLKNWIILDVNFNLSFSLRCELEEIEGLETTYHNEYKVKLIKGELFSYEQFTSELDKIMSKHATNIEQITKQVTPQKPKKNWLMNLWQKYTT